MPSELDHDRQASLLTPTQRKYLDPNVETDIEPNTPHSRLTRNRIRDRVRAGIGDFRLLMSELDARDRQQIFGRRGSPEEGRLAWDRELRESVQTMFGFIYRCYFVPEGVPLVDSRFRFELSRGIERALEIEYPDTEATATVEIDAKLLREYEAEAIRKYQEGKPVDVNEIYALFGKGGDHLDLPAEFILRPADDGSDSADSDAQ